MVKLKIAVNSHGHTIGVKEGKYPIPNVELDVVNVEPMIAAYRRMVRDVEFDVCELAPTTYLLAKEFGAPFTALPIFVNRRFHHGDIQCSANSGITESKQLEHRRFGIRAYTVTTCLWNRGILQHERDVDIDTITWVTDDEEHVAQYEPPSNVVKAPPGESLASMIRSGEIDAALGGAAGTGRTGAPTEGWNSGAIDVAAVAQEKNDNEPYKLIADPKPLEIEWFQRTGIYPIHGLIVVKDDIIKEHQQAVSDLYDAFVAAKNDHVKDMLANGPSYPQDERFLKLREIVGDDILPYGLSENRPTVDALVQYAVEQKIIKQPIPLEELFVPGIGW